MTEDTNIQSYYISYVSRIFCILAILLGIYHVAMSVVYQATTYDEYNHYTWSAEYVNNGRLLPRVDSHISTTPVTALNVYASKLVHGLSLENLFNNTPGVNHEWWPRRWIGLGWYLLLVFASFSLTKLVCDDEVAYIVSGLIALNPNIIAHASIVTVDVPFAAVATGLLSALVRYDRRNTFLNSLFVGVLFASCFIVKFSAILCIPITLFYVLLSIFTRGFSWKSTFIAALCFLGSIAIAVCCINLAYGFLEIQYFTHSYAIESKELQKIIKSLPDLFLPLSQSFISGIDACFARDGNKSWNVIIHDTWYPKGLPLYFFYTYAYKTQFSVLFFTILGLMLFFMKEKIVHSKALLFHFLLSMFYFSCIFSTQVGFRYVIYLLPVLYIFMCVGLRNIVRQYVFLLLPIIVFLESVVTFPKFTGYFLTYYDSVIVPEKEAFKYVIDSNLDWNQTATLFWENRIDNAPVDPDVLQPGLNIYSANRLAGVWWDFAKHAWVRRTQIPVEVRALNYYAYDLDDANFKRYLHDQRMLHAHELSNTMCKKDGVTKVTLVPGESKTFSGNMVCLTANEPFYIKIRKVLSSNHEYQIGELLLNEQCNYKNIESNYHAWFKVEEGVHYLCAAYGTYEFTVFRMNENLY